MGFSVDSMTPETWKDLLESVIPESSKTPHKCLVSNKNTIQVCNSLDAIPVGYHKMRLREIIDLTKTEFEIFSDTPPEMAQEIVHAVKCIADSRSAEAHTLAKAVYGTFLKVIGFLPVVGRAAEGARKEIEDEEKEIREAYSILTPTDQKFLQEVEEIIDRGVDHEEDSRMFLTQTIKKCQESLQPNGRGMLVRFHNDHTRGGICARLIDGQGVDQEISALEEKEDPEVHCNEQFQKIEACLFKETDKKWLGCLQALTLQGVLRGAVENLISAVSEKGFEWMAKSPCYYAIEPDRSSPIEIFVIRDAQNEIQKFFVKLTLTSDLQRKEGNDVVGSVGSVKTALSFDAMVDATIDNLIHEHTLKKG